MSDIERLRLLLDRITYKPSWRFELARAHREHAGTMGEIIDVLVWMTLTAPDVNDPSKPITLSCMRSFPLSYLTAMTDDEIIFHVIRRVVMEAEMHEIDEWLKFGGIQVRNPHHSETP